MQSLLVAYIHVETCNRDKNYRNVEFETHLRNFFIHTFFLIGADQHAVVF